jgi:hypothetical protein
MRFKHHCLIQLAFNFCSTLAIFSGASLPIIMLNSSALLKAKFFLNFQGKNSEISVSLYFKKVMLR